jgi:hypothetical protein
LNLWCCLFNCIDFEIGSDLEEDSSEDEAASEAKMEKLLLDNLSSSEEDTVQAPVRKKW